MIKFNHFVGIDISKKTFDTGLIINSNYRHQTPGFSADAKGLYRFHGLAGVLQSTGR